MRARRDVVFVDQRGTGDSHRLQCRIVAEGSAAQGAFGDLLPADRIRACREALGPIADLRLYTTPIAMDDLDEVRAAMGYRSINLYGTSYGSLAALQYLRQHPVRARSLTLAGVATPAQKLPLHFAAGAQAALDHVIADCAADAACHHAFPELRSARRVPLVVHRAAQGDWVPFARATSRTLSGTSPNFAMAATPPHWGAEAARTLPNSRQILIRNAAHWYFNDCLRDLAGDFVAKGSVRDRDTRCVEAIRRPPFLTR